MKFFDLTLPLSAKIPSWPNDTVYSRTEIKTSAIKSKLILSSHFGTHIDAPKHFLFNKNSVDKIPFNSLVGIYHVYEFKSENLISLEDVKKLGVKNGARILFKTKNSNLLAKKNFTSNYVSLSLEAAKYLAQKKILLVGIDYFGIEAKSSPEHPVHKELLSKNIVIAEGLDLRQVKPGIYDGAILPLLISGGDGAPARAVLWRH